MDYCSDKILKSLDFIEFDTKMKAILNLNLSHSMLGFNFKNKKITSTKFYYVFYGDLMNFNKFPIPELEDIYMNVMKNRSDYHLQTKHSLGGGLTFVIKFDEELNITKGFYFRVKSENRLFLENTMDLYSHYAIEFDDFESGYGQYVLFKDSKIEKNEYLYLNNVSKIKDTQNIYFSKAKAIEISSAGDRNIKTKKFIALGGNETIGNDFYASLPSELVKFNKKDWVCPAINLDSGQQSLYYFNKYVQFSPKFL